MHANTYPKTLRRGERVTTVLKEVVELVGGCAIAGVGFFALAGELQARFIEEDDDSVHPLDRSLVLSEEADDD